MWLLKQLKAKIDLCRHDSCTLTTFANKNKKRTKISSRIKCPPSEWLYNNFKSFTEDKTSVAEWRKSLRKYFKMYSKVDCCCCAVTLNAPNLNVIRFYATISFIILLWTVFCSKIYLLHYIKKKSSDKSRSKKNKP